MFPLSTEPGAFYPNLRGAYCFEEGRYATFPRKSSFFFQKHWMLVVKRKGELLVLRSLLSMNKQLISCSWRALQQGKTDCVYFGWSERVVLHISSRTFLLGL